MDKAMSAATVEKAEKAASAKEPSVKPSRGKTVRSILGLVFVLTILVFFIAFVAGVPLPGLASPHEEKTVAAPPPLGVHRVQEIPHSLLVPEDVRVALGIRKGGKERIVAVKPPDASTMRPLVLSGTTDLDPTRISHLRARFAPAEVSEIGKVTDPTRRTKSDETAYRQLRAGDWVKKGDVLAVLHSELVGMKKHDLIEAVVQLKMDEEFLERARNTGQAIPETFLINFQRNVATDRSTIDRALKTLKLWGIPKEDIDAVYKEAEEIGKRKGKGKRGETKEYDWSRVELRAPEDGVIMERNVSERDLIQDPSICLFQIGKVGRLLVKANAPEDDLPTLLKLPAESRRWSVRVMTQQHSIEGPIDDISYIMDVNQHNAVVKGYIENPLGPDGLPMLRGGQFLSCTIPLPPPENVVEVPVTAVVDDGRQIIVFVQPDPDKPIFTMRRVLVAKRFEKTLFVRSQLTPKEEEHTPEDKDFELLPPRPLRPGERVLVTGALELKRELEDRESKAEQE
jgi:cobalt-zinc-cadmium efflux system membrane fusion protein